MAFPPFAEVLDRQLLAQGLSLRAFARAVGVPVSLLSKLKKGQRSVPQQRIEAWADFFDLQGNARTAFVDSAMWTTVPARLRPWLEVKLDAGRGSGRRR